MTKPADYTERIALIRDFPEKLENAIAGLSDAQLAQVTPVDPWTVGQIVHHCADSHLNSLVRLKLILTEDKPLLKNYEQDAWVVMADETPEFIQSSLMILRGLHPRWVAVFENVQDDQWEKFGIHTESGKMNVHDLLNIYSDHCKDHLEQMALIVEALS